MQSSLIIAEEEEEEEEEGEEEEEEEEEERKKGESGMELKVLEVEKMEFWPLQHPLEPDDEDRPVICPMPNSTSLLHKGTTMHNGKRTPESWRKRTEVSREVKTAAAAETAVRVVRKRHHHTLSRPDHLMAGMSQLPTTENFTIFQMLQQLDKFESS